MSGYPRPIERNFQIGKGETRFSIYQRQSELDDSDFSCGIAFLPLRLTLARYNGPSHPAWYSRDEGPQRQTDVGHSAI